MMDIRFPLGPIDPRRSRFPCCIVWTPLPVISWFIPFIGHIGICREDGVILDFFGPNFVCVDHFTHSIEQRKGPNEIVSWDDALKKSAQEYQHRNYNLLACNCHSFVANNLNRMAYGGHDKWNVVNLAVLMFFRGTWVSKTSAARSLLPFPVS